MVPAMFYDQGSGGRSSGPTLDQQVAEHVATLKLKGKLEPLGLVSKDDVPLALLQIQTLGQNIWRELEAIVRFSCPLIFPKLDNISDEEYALRFKIVFDEQIMRGIQLVARESRKGEYVSLSQLAEEIYSPESQEYGPFRSRLRKKVLTPLEDLGIFSYTEDYGVSSGGHEYHKGFKITSGPALELFIKHIFKPWFERHAMFVADLLREKEI